VATEIFFQAEAWWLKPAEGELRTLAIELDWLKPGAADLPTSVDFFPTTSEDFEVQPESNLLVNSPGELQLAKTVKKFSGNWPKTISGVIVLQKAGNRLGFEVSVPVHEQNPNATPSDKASGPAVAATAVATTAAAPSATAPATIPPEPSRPFWLMLIYAFIGGLILNVMPCVLPVIALKILGFVSEAKSSPKEVRLLGLIYSGGVLVSFLALASVVLAVKFAGHQAAWGMQFGNPVFLVCLVTLVTLVALNLFGIFEVTLAGGAMNVASDLSSKSGRPGAFFNGMLATVLATPCTAPILGSALGFAFTQSAWVLVAIFLTIGAGLAAPYLILSWNPAWLKFLPKPGAWMEKFKLAMGFPMLAAALWLYNVSASTYGKSVIWLGIFLIFLAAAGWTFGTFVQRGRRRQSWGLVATLLLLVGGYGYALEAELDWRHPVAQTNPDNQLSESVGGIAWQPWSQAALAKARTSGRPVLVDFTADWCLTCQVNKKTSLETAAVREKLRQSDTIALLADYTHTPDNITTELARYNRAGVPLVLVYSKDPSAPPTVLPEVLTPGIVLNALEQAAK
jgi:thiol:disulfide interchange protein